MTEWRAVVGYESLYEVSDDGRVGGLTRIRPSDNATLKGRLLIPAASPSGYLRVILCRDGQRANRTVHSLVLEAFDRPRPDGLWGLHRDDNPANNHINNLYWGTPPQNAQDRVRNGNDFHARQDECNRGHPLAHPNLVLGHLKAQQRSCRACAQARTAARRNGRVGDEVWIQQTADVKFAQIMVGA